MPDKERIRAICLALIAGTILIIVCELLGFPCGLIMAVGAIPGIIYCVHYGIQDYRKFFKD